MAKTVDIPAGLLVAAGEILHGADWQGPLADTLGLTNTRTLERWAAAARRGETVRVSRSLAGELAQLVEGRLEAVAGALRQAAGS